MRYLYRRRFFLAVVDSSSGGGSDTPSDYAEEYLTFNITSNGKIKITSGTNYYYNINDSGWTQCETRIDVVAGDVVKFKGDCVRYSTIKFEGCTCGFIVSGNIMSIYSTIIDFTTNTTIEISEAFFELFKDCEGLINASNLILPATTLTNYCYASMFDGCSSLTVGPDLPATILVNNCYDSMFEDCTSLIKAPILRATNLIDYCYYRMFDGCTSIDSIVCLATNITGFQDPLYKWVRNVASSGIFYKDSNASDWSSGEDGIPTGWMILNYGETPLLWTKNSYTCDVLTSTPDYPTLANPENLPVTYSSSSTSVATISNQGAITIQGTGSTTITATFAGNSTYNATTISYTLTITKANANIAWSTSIVSVLLNGTLDAPTLSNPDNLIITYSSSDTSVATIDSSTGDITLVDEGTTTISAIFAGNSIYEAATVTYSLEVIASGVLIDWGVDATNEYTPYVGRSYITDVSNLTSSRLTVNYVRANGSSGSFESSFLRTSSSYGNPTQGITGFKTWIEHYISSYGNKINKWDDVISNTTILSTWENTSGVQVVYGWMGDLSVSGQAWDDKYTTKKIAAFKNCNLLGVIVMDGDMIKAAQYCNVSVKAWDGSEMTNDGRPCVSFDPNAALGAKGLMLAIVYTE